MTSTTLQISMPMLGAAAAVFCLFNPLAVLAVLWEWFVSLVVTGISIASWNLVGLRLSARTILALLIDHRYFFTLLNIAVCATVLQPCESVVPEHHFSFDLDWTLPLMFRAVLCGWVILARVVLSATHDSRSVLLKLRIAVLWMLPAVSGICFLVWLEGRRASLRDLFRSGGALAVSDDARYESLRTAQNTVLSAVVISTYSLMLDLAKPALLVVATVLRSGWEEARYGGSAYWQMDSQVALDFAVSSVDLLVAVQHGPLRDWRGVPVPWLVQIMTLYRLYHVFVRWSVYAGFRSLLHSFPERLDLEDSEVGCLICRDALKRGESVRALPCGHTFHSRCIHHWLATSPVCPLCRTDPWKSLLNRHRHQSEESSDDDTHGVRGSAANAVRRTEVPVEDRVAAAAATNVALTSPMAPSVPSARRGGTVRGSGLRDGSWGSLPHRGSATVAATGRPRSSSAAFGEVVPVGQGAPWMDPSTAAGAGRVSRQQVPAAAVPLPGPPQLASNLVTATTRVQNPPLAHSEAEAIPSSSAATQEEPPARAKKRLRSSAKRIAATTTVAVSSTEDDDDHDRLLPPAKKRRAEARKSGPRRR